ncbi:MAG: hypothetical protein M1821_003142 [Bathelium mastoideum]|nr:MAG: hypothetical protein M1821_003142 [Bathelium mastoideum]
MFESGDAAAGGGPMIWPSLASEAAVLSDVTREDGFLGPMAIIVGLLVIPLLIIEIEATPKDEVVVGALFNKLPVSRELRPSDGDTPDRGADDVDGWENSKVLELDNGEAEIGLSRG